LRSALLVGVVLALAGCGGSSNASKPTPTPTPKPFVATDAGFSAVFPTTPQQSTQNTTQTGVSITMTLYLATTNDEQVGVGVAQLPLAPQGAAIQAGLDGAVDGSAKNTNGTIVSRSNTTFLGQPAEDAVIQAQGAVAHERVFFTGSKIWVLEGITRSLDAKHPHYDTLVATFKTL
jgi:hypothetical protein